MEDAKAEGSAVGSAADSEEEQEDRREDHGGRGRGNEVEAQEKAHRVLSPAVIAPYSSA